MHMHRHIHKSHTQIVDMAGSEVSCPKRCLTELRGQMPKTRLYWPATMEPGADSQQYTVCLPM